MSQEEGQAIEQPASFDDSVAQARALLDAEDSPAQEIQTPTETPVETPTETPAEAPAETPVEVKAEEIQLDPDAPLFEIEEVREGGIKEVVKRSLNELKKERMMQADYTRKTQELAAKQKAIPDEAKKLAQPLITQAEQALTLANQVVTELVAPELVGMTPQKMAELSQSDPAEFARLLGKQNLVASQMQQIAHRQRQIAEIKQNERLQELAKIAQDSIEVLQRDVPNWGQEVYGSLLKTGEEYGFSPTELGQVASVADLKPVYFTDARIIKLLSDAQKYRDIQKGKPALDKKIAVVPKVMKPGTAEKPDPKTEAVEKAFGRLKKSGTTEDAIAAAKFLV